MRGKGSIDGPWFKAFSADGREIGEYSSKTKCEAAIAEDELRQLAIQFLFGTPDPDEEAPAWLVSEVIRYVKISMKPDHDWGKMQQKAELAESLWNQSLDEEIG